MTLACDDESSRGDPVSLWINNFGKFLYQSKKELLEPSGKVWYRPKLLIFFYFQQPLPQDFIWLLLVLPRMEENMLRCKLERQINWTWILVWIIPCQTYRIGKARYSKTTMKRWKKKQSFAFGGAFQNAHNDWMGRQSGTHSALSKVFPDRKQLFNIFLFQPSHRCFFWWQL